jgi:hypothetical protein
VIKQPYSVVLFDEVEKAHPRILDILLQIMEEGRLTDGQGRQANFAEAVILLTSNLGAVYLNNPANLEDADLNTQAREMALNDVKGYFRPEFLNRLDDIISSTRSATVMRGILDLRAKRSWRPSAGSRRGHPAAGLAAGPEQGSRDGRRLPGASCSGMCARSTSAHARGAAGGSSSTPARTD